LLGNVIGLVQMHKEVSRSDTALSCELWNKEEVEALVGQVVLDQFLVDDGARLRIFDPSLLVLDEHPLVDPLVDDDKSNVRT